MYQPIDLQTGPVYDRIEEGGRPLQIGKWQV